jgi:hypothetical protein
MYKNVNYQTKSSSLFCHFTIEPMNLPRFRSTGGLLR